MLPVQKEGDLVDYRGLLHRDGSVLSEVKPEDLASPDALYKSLGFKTAVGMPFKVNDMCVNHLFVNERFVAWFLYFFGSNVSSSKFRSSA